MPKTIRTALSLLVVMTVVLGFVYPVAVWCLGQIIFPHEANGSLIPYKGRVVGSALIGQTFVGDRYFWPRPSAIKQHSYAPLASGASNMNPANPALYQNVKQQAIKLAAAHGKTVQPIPIDLVTASGSGLDPHISLKAALYQAQRIAKARKIPLDTVHALIIQQREKPTFGFLGEERINVLLLNIALDRQMGTRHE